MTQSSQSSYKIISTPRFRQFLIKKQKEHVRREWLKTVNRAADMLHESKSGRMPHNGMIMTLDWLEDGGVCTTQNTLSSRLRQWQNMLLLPASKDLSNVPTQKTFCIVTVDLNHTTISSLSQLGA